jgi:uncharacterized protein (TIGR03435 family)
MMRVLPLFAAAAMLAGAALPAAQQPASFDVASVRPNHAPIMDPDDSSISIEPGGTFKTVNYPLRLLILYAYQIQNFQLEAPEWTLSSRFDIVARPGDAAAPAAAAVNATRTMLQGLLADRFQLAAHRETQQRPIYELVRVRGDGQPGPRLRRSTGECTARRAAVQNGTSTNPPRPPGPGGCGVSTRLGRIAFGGSPVSAVANVLSPLVQRVVVDRTGLTGEWEFELTFTPDPSTLSLPPGFPLPPVAANADPNAASLFTALEEQLGLKLQPARGPVEMLVVDRVQQPTDN